MSMMSSFDWFFFGRLVSYYVFTGALLTYNVGFYYL